uniref:Integrase catalytic domain-containing protein n=1 Tax=Knipowitschia caucasica TaxID=637954 RepID=A0AAV2KIM1_KNICA
MFPMDGARLQVKKEADECSIEMPACSEVRTENFISHYPDFSDSRRWNTAGRAREPSLDVNKDGGARPLIATGSMTLRFSGSGNLEAYLAQFELLAATVGWSGQMKAVQLALFLTEEAATCLLLLSPDERQDYAMLVGVLQRRFGVLNLKDSMRCEFKNRVRQPGESLHSLAHEIESLGRRAYSTLQSVIQSELVRDQFVHALTPVELRLHVQLIRPVSLSQALKLALERETAFGASKRTELMVTAASKVEYKPALAEELIHAVKNLAVRPKGADTQSPSNLPPSCWRCGKPGDTLRCCPEAKGVSLIWEKNCGGLDEQQKEELWKECLVHLDYVLVHGKSFRVALDSLRLVLGRIATAGLKLHPDKCHFMRREVEFLGHKVDGEGIGTLQEQIQAIRDWPSPGNQKQLKSFLGRASYYKREPEGQVARWLEELQSFHFEILPAAEPACCSVEVECSPDWASEQEKDKDLRPVRQWVIRVSDQGNKYVMCAMDYFTKWPEVYALPDQEAETVADTLLEGMFSRFGTPDIIH